ncbi:hypothetical protein HPB47_023438 [Ixodes persulcatus]|uniref:Uncharacterized protein n=1 Tax=Ixodes persulcatus TaxID=34615 RepID=A0AC60Q9E2_IXOPE|nr:hypothetical protein HPB47_023438 [Ixodes persulcatus]
MDAVATGMVNMAGSRPAEGFPLPDASVVFLLLPLLRRCESPLYLLLRGASLPLLRRDASRASGPFLLPRRVEPGRSAGNRELPLDRSSARVRVIPLPARVVPFLFHLQSGRLPQSRLFLFLVRPARTPPIQTLRVHVQTLARVLRPLLFLRVPFQLGVPLPSPRVLQRSGNLCPRRMLSPLSTTHLLRHPRTTAGPKPAGHPAAPKLRLRVLPVTVRQCWCRHLRIRPMWSLDPGLFGYPIKEYVFGPRRSQTSLLFWGVPALGPAGACRLASLASASAEAAVRDPAYYNRDQWCAVQIMAAAPRSRRTCAAAATAAWRNALKRRSHYAQRAAAGYFAAPPMERGGARAYHVTSGGSRGRQLQIRFAP